MSRNDDDAYVEQLARKLETVPPRRDPSGVYPRAIAGASDAGSPGDAEGDAAVTGEG